MTKQTLFSNKTDMISYYSADFPGLSLPGDAGNVDPKTRLEHVNAMVDLSCRMTLSGWWNTLIEARNAVANARNDLAAALRALKRSRHHSKFDVFAFVMALVFVTAMFVIELLFSKGTLGPAFGYDPDSWESWSLAVLVLALIAAAHIPASHLAGLLKQMADSSGALKKAVSVSITVAVAAGMLYANYKAVAELAPLRQQIAVMLQSSANAIGLAPDHDNDQNSTNGDVDEKALSECILVLSVVTALDSLALLVLLHGQTNKLHHRGERRECEVKREEARARLREARDQYQYARYVWKHRERRLAAIAQAMLKREECLINRRPEEDKDQSPRAWVNKTVNNAGRLRLVS